MSTWTRRQAIRCAGIGAGAALAGGIIFSLIAWCALGFDWGPAGADAGTLVSAMVLIPLALGLAWLRSRGILPGLMLGLVLVFQAQDQGQVYTRFVRFMQPWEALPKTNDTVQVPPPPQAGEDPWRIYEKDDSFPNAELLKGYENMEGRESMPLDSFLRIKGAFGQRWWDWANLYGIRYVVFHSMAGSSDPGDTIRIMHNPRAFPRAWLVGRIRSVAGDEDAYRLLSDPGFDPRLSVALAGNHGTMNGPPPAGSVRWVSRSPQSSAMDVTSDRDAVLLVSNAWYPSWTAQVDGQGSPVLKADGGLQAIILPSGSHHVVLRFDPSLFNAALLAAMFACIVLAGLAYGERWRRPAGSGSAAPPLS